MRTSAARLVRPLARLCFSPRLASSSVYPLPRPRLGAITPSRIIPSSLSSAACKYSTAPDSESPSILPPPSQTSSPSPSPSSESAPSPASATFSFPLPEKPYYQLTFTCKKCETRSTHKVSKQGYQVGTVLIQCPGCEVRHLIADNLGIFRDKPTNIEDILREKGEKIAKGIKYENGDIELLPPKEDAPEGAPPALETEDAQNNTSPAEGIQGAQGSVPAETKPQETK